VTLAKFDQWQGAQKLGDMWTLGRGAERLRCELRTHPMGWELRRTIDGQLLASQVVKAPEEPQVFALAEEWKADALTRGWQDAG
jgi:hypothetical protein